MVELLLRALIGLAVGSSVVGGTIKVVGLINKSVLVKKIKELFKRVNPFLAKVTKKNDEGVTVIVYENGDNANVYTDGDNAFNKILRDKAKNAKNSSEFFSEEVTFTGKIADDISEGDEIPLTN